MVGKKSNAHLSPMQIGGVIGIMTTVTTSLLLCRSSSGRTGMLQGGQGIQASSAACTRRFSLQLSSDRITGVTNDQ